MRLNSYSSILILGLCLCLTYPDTLYADQEFFPYLAEVTADQVNVRSGQSANFERLCQLDKGDEVVVLEKGFSWYKIQMPPTAKSFVSKEYIQYLGQNAGGVIGNRVNIRAGAGIHFTVLGQLVKGEQIAIIEEMDEWYRIQPVAQSSGWVAEQFIAFKSNDVSEYRAKNYVTPTVTDTFIGLDEDLDAVASEDKAVEEAGVLEDREEEASEEKTADAIEIEDGELFKAVGYVEKYEKGNKDAIFYRLVQRGRPVCYVKGVNHILGRFVHQKVSVEGNIIKKFQSKYIYPTITVTRVRLML